VLKVDLLEHELQREHVRVAISFATVRGGEVGLVGREWATLMSQLSSRPSGFVRYDQLCGRLAGPVAGPVPYLPTVELESPRQPPEILDRSVPQDV